MKAGLFRCDSCKREETALGLPAGWLEVKFWSGRMYWYHLCGYPCLTTWSRKRDSYYSQSDATSVNSVEHKAGRIG